MPMSSFAHSHVVYVLVRVLVWVLVRLLRVLVRLVRVFSYCMQRQRYSWLIFRCL